MNRLLSMISVLLFATFALADEGEDAAQKRKLKQTQTYTYTLPDSVTTQSNEVEKTPQDEKRREKLIQDLRQLYQANFL